MKRAISVAAIAASFAAPGFAQDPAGEDLEEILQPPDPDAVRFSLTGGYEFGLSADFDNGGDVGVSRFDFNLGAQTRLEDNLNLQASIGYELMTYDFGGTSVFGAMDPWEDVHTLRAGAIFSTALEEDWELYGGPFVQFSHEAGAGLADGFTGGAFVAISKRLSDELTLGGGFGYTSEIEDNGKLFPIIAVDWRFAEDWRLATLTRANRGGAEVIWEFADGWEAAAGIAFAEHRFRLDDEDIAPDGVGVEDYTSISGRISHDFSPQFRLELIGGLNSGEIELEASNGGNLARDDFENAFFFGLRGRLRF